MFIIFNGIKIIFNFPLCTKAWFHLIITKTIIGKKCMYDMFFLVGKCFIKYFFCNKWFAAAVVIKPNIFFVKFIYMQWQRRFKVTHNAFHCMVWYAPYSEETKDMVYAECIEITFHLCKALFPPGEIILLHFLPVVSGKAPVLSFYSKVVGWCAGLHIDMIEFRLLPCIGTITVHANGYISFYNNSIFMCVSSCVL